MGGIFVIGRSFYVWVRAGASKVIKQGLFRVWSEECLLFRLLGAVAHPSVHNDDKNNTVMIGFIKTLQSFDKHFVRESLLGGLTRNHVGAYEHHAAVPDVIAVYGAGRRVSHPPCLADAARADGRGAIGRRRSISDVHSPSNYVSVNA